MPTLSWFRRFLWGKIWFEGFAPCKRNWHFATLLLAVWPTHWIVLRPLARAKPDMGRPWSNLALLPLPRRPCGQDAVRLRQGRHRCSHMVHKDTPEMKKWDRWAIWYKPLGYQVQAVGLSGTSHLVQAIISCRVKVENNIFHSAAHHGADIFQIFFTCWIIEKTFGVCF